jgi:hypothetical protein
MPTEETLPAGSTLFCEDSSANLIVPDYSPLQTPNTGWFFGGGTLNEIQFNNGNISIGYDSSLPSAIIQSGVIQQISPVSPGVYRISFNFKIIEKTNPQDTARLYVQEALGNLNGKGMGGALLEGDVGETVAYEFEFTNIVDSLQISLHNASQASGGAVYIHFTDILLCKIGELPAEICCLCDPVSFRYQFFTQYLGSVPELETFNTSFWNLDYVSDHTWIGYQQGLNGGSFQPLWNCTATLSNSNSPTFTIVFTYDIYTLTMVVRRPSGCVGSFFWVSTTISPSVTPLPTLAAFTDEVGLVGYSTCAVDPVLQTLNYSLEFIKDDTQPSDEAVFIQLQTELPVFVAKTKKEDYQWDEAFLTGIFNIDGIVTVSLQSFRVYVEKSNLFSWEEILSPLIEYLRIELDAVDVNLVSSLTLGAITQRRPN